MLENYRREDDTTCPYCGVEMEVIGPPGPRHRMSCPIAIEAADRTRVSARREQRFIRDYIGRHACGCVVTANGIEDICLRSDCVILQDAERLGY